MSDFFREVDEELRNERMRNIWKNYGMFIIGGIIFLVVATAAYRFYVYWSESQAAASGDKYLKAIQLAEDGDRAGAQAILAELSKEGSGAYPMLARFRSASALLGEGKIDAAVAAFDEFSNDASLPNDIRDYARLQASMAAVDIEGYEAIVKRTEGLISDETNPWRHLAREALALSALKAGNLKEAAKWVQELKSAPEIPQGLRQRVQVVEDLIVSRGGTLPSSGESG